MKTLKLTDREVRIRGFKILVQMLGDVDAERFIALTNREPMDYTSWRGENMYVGESVHDVAERAREAAARYFAEQKMVPAVEQTMSLQGRAAE